MTSRPFRAAGRATFLVRAGDPSPAMRPSRLVSRDVAPEAGDDVARLLGGSAARRFAGSAPARRRPSNRQQLGEIRNDRDGNN